MINLFIKKFFSGNKRTILARKNIIASFGIKAISIIVGFIMVPICLEYLDQEKYGIWATFASFFAWVSFFDIGLGNGLRNRLAEALSKNNHQLGKILVSTTYAAITIIVLIAFVVFFTANYFIDWASFFNVDESFNHELKALSYIVFGAFFFQLIIMLIKFILMADQRPAISNSFGPIANIISLIVILILIQVSDGSLLYLGIAMSLTPILVISIASLYLFKTRYRKIAPSIKMIQFKYAKDLLGLGFNFFIIRFSVLVLFSSSKIIIVRIFGPAEVTVYDIAYKYFFILFMAFSIIVNTYWSPITDAWVKKEVDWIKNVIMSLGKVWVLVTIGSFILLLFSDPIFNLWIGKNRMQEISIPFNFRILLIIQFAIFSFGNIFSVFVNGIAKIRLQMLTQLIGVFIFVPLIYLFTIVLELGLSGIVLATILSNFYSLFIAPIQYYKLINNKAYGIWNK